jgi:hypothetical protein
MREIFSNPYLVVLIDDVRGVLIVRRTKERFSTTEIIRETFSTALDKSLEFSTPRALLMDFRDSPLRNDAAFDAAMMSLREKMIAFRARFERHAVLIKTAVGRLQLERIRRERSQDMGEIFHNEAEAFTYLTEPGRAAARR